MSTVTHSGIEGQVARVLATALDAEGQLRDVLVLLSERHERDYDVSGTADVLAGWPSLHLRWLEPLVGRYGSARTDRATRLREVLFKHDPAGGMGTLDDLQDVSIVAEECETAWTILFQGAKELHDDELLRVSSDAREHTKRTLRWLRTAIDHTAPETLAVVADPQHEAQASKPRKPSAATDGRTPAERRAPADGAMARWIREGRGAVQHPPE